MIFLFFAGILLIMLSILGFVAYLKQYKTYSVKELLVSSVVMLAIGVLTTYFSVL